MDKFVQPLSLITASPQRECSKDLFATAVRQQQLKASEAATQVLSEAADVLNLMLKVCTTRVVVQGQTSVIFAFPPACKGQEKQWTEDKVGVYYYRYEVPKGKSVLLDTGFVVGEKKDDKTVINGFLEARQSNSDVCYKYTKWWTDEVPYDQYRRWFGGLPTLLEYAGSTSRYLTPRRLINTPFVLTLTSKLRDHGLGVSVYQTYGSGIVYFNVSFLPR